MASNAPTDTRLLSTTEDVQQAISSLLRCASKQVVLVTPYVSLDELGWLKRAIQDALARRVAVSMFVREQGNKTAEVARSADELVELGLHLRCVPSLHAKVYWSAESAILTSLNLLASSLNNSIEVGMVVGPGPIHAEIKKFIDEKVVRYAEDLPSQGRRFERAGEHEGQPASRHEEKKRNRERMLPIERAASDVLGVLGRLFSKGDGHCIRCRDTIPRAPQRPYCKADYESWAQWGNEHYVDKYCHGCGEEFGATMRKPLCPTCYRRAA